MYKFLNSKIFNKIDHRSNKHYILFDNGLLLTWGELDAPGTTKAVNVIFPLNYKTAPCVIVVPKSSSGGNPQFSNFGYNVTTAGFDYYNANTKYTFFAIGEGIK